MSNGMVKGMWLCGLALLLLVVGMLLVDDASGARTALQSTKVLRPVGKNVTLKESDRVYIHSVTDAVQFQLSSKNCGLLRRFTVNLEDQVSPEGFLMDVLGFQWYLFYFHAKGEFLELVFEGVSSYLISFRWPSLDTCLDSAGLTFVFDKKSEVAVPYNSNSKQSNPYPNLPSLGYPDGDYRYLHTTTRSHAKGTFHAFIPVGAMVLFVGVCVRCCHYCRYKAEMHKRARSIADAGTEGVEAEVATPPSPPPQDSDAPPRYDEICISEPPPPSYAELFQVVAASGEDKAKDGPGAAAEEEEQEDHALLDGVLASPPAAPQYSEVIELPLQQQDSTAPDPAAAAQPERATLIPPSQDTTEPVTPGDPPNPSASARETTAPPTDAAVSRSSAMMRALTSLNQARRKTHFAFRRLVEEREDQRHLPTSSQFK
ncbi:uncharacterized protein LOC122263124 [Penaeus japonicus]|uniref:uncharacterized protein LOC122263124 n=1 Tax=Penaeus japonicus TaxID=27405 RepID=UPI001C715DDD|nr:uncharacterized protein LOC122263124 [Penaeus japonicus]XP_042887384.1 uncharacterized protein LOC122263124 [Penaeus japonicus]XP_042887385.1 uncharacterized protein LOC122263124 [Penaeus japonicus]XP_042887386.1 uncharacterized protein LOC122263124 [Penaeus japonicus]